MPLCVSRAVLALSLACLVGACGTSRPRDDDSVRADKAERAEGAPGTGAGAAPRTDDPRRVTQVEWTLTHLGGVPVSLPEGRRVPTLQLTVSDSGTIHAGGTTGCNGYGGPATLGDATLTFGPLVSTKMACPDAMELETRFLAALAETDGYRVQDEFLQLLDAGDVVARFRAP